MNKIIIDREKCSLCGKCVEICPEKVFVLNTSLPHKRGEGKEGRNKAFVEPVYEDECIACRHCIAICDKSAISHKDMNMAEFIGVPEDISINPDKLFLFFRSRRSIRKYLNKEVPQEIIDKLIETGRYSPTGHNFENVEYVVVKDRDKIKELAGMTASFYKFGVTLLKSKVVKKVVSGIMGKDQINKLAEMIPTFERLSKYWEKGEDLIFRGAPVVIITHADKSDTIAKDNCDLALCHIMLMAHAYGLGTCLIGLFTGAAQRSRKISRALGIPKTNKIYGTLVLGYSKYKYKRLVSRKPAKVKYI